MKKFLIKSVVFTFIIFFIIVFFFLLLNFSEDKIISNEQTIIIAGDSNTECAINDQKISNALNISKSGESYFYTFYKLKHLIHRNEHIEKVYLSFSPHNLVTEETRITEGGSIYNNFIKYSPVLDSESIYYLFKKDKKNVFLSFLKSPISFFEKGSFLKNKLSSTLWGGYLYLDRNNLDKEIKSSQKFSRVYSQKNIDDIEVRYLKKISHLLEIYNIELVLLNTPKWTDFYKNSNHLEFYYKVYEKDFSNLKLLDYSSLFSRKELFGDFTHLNFKGSQKFTEFFNSEVIIKILENE